MGKVQDAETVLQERPPWEKLEKWLAAGNFDFTPTWTTHPEILRAKSTCSQQHLVSVWRWLVSSVINNKQQQINLSITSDTILDLKPESNISSYIQQWPFNPTF